MNRPVPLTQPVQQIVSGHEAVIAEYDSLPVKSLSYEALHKYAAALSEAQSIYAHWGHHKTADAHGRRLHIVSAEAKRRRIKATDKLPGANHYGN